MNDLRIILLVAGAVLIALMFVWYKWQERRLKQRGDAAFGSRHDDVLLSSARRPAADPPEERVEPVLGVHAAEPAAEEEPAATPAVVAPDRERAAAGGSAADAGGQEPTAEPGRGVEPAGRIESALPVDDRIDAVAIITSASAGSFDAAPLAGIDWSGFSKSVSRYGEQGGTWGALLPGQSYQRVAIAMQLVDRKGPVPGMEFAAFARLLEELAAQRGWRLELSNSESVLQRAAELDRLCVDVDFQIAFNVAAAGDKPFPGTRIRGLAEASGLALAADGSFRRVEGGLLWFTLRNRGATPFSPEHMREFSTRGLTLVLDVPRVPREAFPALRTTLNALANGLQGSIVDEQGRRLDDAALDLVADQLRSIHGRLEQAGIFPGGALALRLFS